MKWTYQKEAQRFGEANPVGNGHIGGMVYGGILKDRVDLSELTFFSGEASMEKDGRPGAADAFYRMRDVLKKEEFARAKEVAEDFIGRRNNYGTNLPVGHLEITLLGNLKPVPMSYCRALDMEMGIASSGFCVMDENREEIQIQRKVYASWPDKVLVYVLECDRKISLCLSCQNAGEDGGVVYQKDSVAFHTYAHETMHSDGKSGTMLSGRISADTDGNILLKKEGLQIEKASRCVFFISMATDFGRKNIGLQALEEETENIVCRAEALGEDSLRKRHTEDIKRYMNRVQLELAGNEQKLIAGMFQYGRYLLLSSSREDSRLPAHLQGIWNDNVACRIGWTCDMHLDINTQMNYWPSEVTNLSEVNQPLFAWIEDVLAPAGRYHAQNNYGIEGWVGEIVSNSWGFAAPYWASPIAPCPTGGVWILSHMWETFLFSQDIDFLINKAYPLIYEAAAFFRKYIFEENGYYSCGPSISPENSFAADGNVYQISNGCTYEILMIRELFEKLYEMEEYMGSHSALGAEVHELSGKLLPYRILEDGTIAEWAHGYPAADGQHRHTSHLLGLYPFSQITPDKTPELARAAEKTIEKRLYPEENWEDTGWARSMLMLYSARLRDGEACLYHIRRMLGGLLEKNHMIIHPPTRGAGSFANVYELDGNTGLTSCIAEMLLQSHDGVLRILPALPKEWMQGSISGLKARGNLELAIRWEGGRLLTGRIQGKPGGRYCLEYQGMRVSAELPESGAVEFTYDSIAGEQIEIKRSIN